MKDMVLVIATTSAGRQTNFLALPTINRCCCWAHRWHRGLRPTRRPVLRPTRRPVLRLRPTLKLSIETGTETETGAASGSGAGVELKAKRQRVPNKLRTTRLVVTEVDDGNFEPKAPEEARACYDNQIGCILRTTATINDEKL